MLCNDAKHKQADLPNTVVTLIEQPHMHIIAKKLNIHLKTEKY